MSKKSVFKCLVLGLIMMTNAVFAAPVQVSDFSKPVILTEKHPIFTINLKGNPTTGYIWLLVDSYNHNYLKPMAYKYVPANKKEVGSSGTFEFTFRALPEAFIIPQQLQPIKFIYTRPWENSTPAQTQLVQLVTTH